MMSLNDLEVEVVCDNCREVASVRRGRTFLCAGCALGVFHPIPAEPETVVECVNCHRTATVNLERALLCQECALEEESRALLASSKDAPAAALPYMLEARDETRKQLAFELHDDTVQVMASVAYQLALVTRRIEDPYIRATIDEIRQQMSAAIARLRHLMFELTPAILEDEGLAPALRSVLEKLRERFDLRFRFQDRLGSDPDPAVRETMYLIANEALANVRKHASATQVEVVLEQDGGELSLRIRDDGVGFRPREAELPDHLGLTAMRERARAIGGRVSVRAAPGAGTSIEFRAPV